MSGFRNWLGALLNGSGANGGRVDFALIREEPTAYSSLESMAKDRPRSATTTSRAESQGNGASRETTVLPSPRSFDGFSEITSFLRSEELCDAPRTHIEKLREYRQVLIIAVTGTIDVSNEAA